MKTTQIMNMIAGASLVMVFAGCASLGNTANFSGPARSELVVWGEAPSLLPRMHDFKLVWNSSLRNAKAARPSELPKLGFFEYSCRVPQGASAWRNFWGVEVDSESVHRFGLLREADGTTLFVDGVPGQKVCTCKQHDVANLEAASAEVGEFTYQRIYEIEDLPYFYD